MAGKDFIEEQRRRQRELVAARKAKQNPDSVVPEPVPVGPAPKKTFSERIKNFWFYYKWFVAGGLFIALTLGIAIHQCASRESYDAEVVLLSYEAYTGGQLDAIERQLEKYAVDFNGDGEVNVQIIDCAYNEKEALDLQNAKRQKLTAVLAANDNALLFLTSEETFQYLESLYEGGFLVDMDLPDDDGKSIVLPESFYEAIDAESENGFVMPRGLRISRRRADEGTVVGQSKGIEEKIKAADKTLENILAEIK